MPVGAPELLHRAARAEDLVQRGPPDLRAAAGRGRRAEHLTQYGGFGVPVVGVEAGGGEGPVQILSDEHGSAGPERPQRVHVRRR